jgi:hypothetical protein
LCGDPIFYIEKIFYHTDLDLELLKSFLDGYQLTLTTTQKDVLLLYTIHQNVWMLSRSSVSDEEVKTLQEKLRRSLSLCLDGI